MPPELTNALRVGQQVLVHFGGKSPDQARYSTVLRGWVTGSYLMLDSPQYQGRAVALVLGAPCSARFLMDDTACGFASTVVRAQRGEPLFRLAWPSDVEFVSIRRHERVGVSIPCALSTPAGVGQRGELRDLSIGGCRIFLAAGLAVDTRIEVSFELPIGSLLGPIAATVRNANPADEGFLVGCQFDSLDDAARIELECFLKLQQEMLRADNGAVRRVLVIGQAPELVEALRRILKPDQWEVVMALNVIDGFYSLRRVSPQVVVAQYDMPDLSGREIARIIHASSTMARLPVMLVGGKESDAADAQAGGAHAFFAAGTAPEALAQAIVECAPPPAPGDAGVLHRF